MILIVRASRKTKIYNKSLRKQKAIVIFNQERDRMKEILNIFMEIHKCYKKESSNKTKIGCTINTFTQTNRD